MSSGGAQKAHGFPKQILRLLDLLSRSESHLLPAGDAIRSDVQLAAFVPAGKSRFEEGQSATNPEELIGAAHAGCFTMALTAQLSRAGITPRRIHTGANVKLEKIGEGFSITMIDLENEADIPGIDEATFQKYALDAKQSCPVSKALAGTEIQLSAKLL
jgi:lipoyl-dependent peroxiredoxin